MNNAIIAVIMGLINAVPHFLRCRKVRPFIYSIPNSRRVDWPQVDPRPGNETWYIDIGDGCLPFTRKEVFTGFLKNTVMVEALYISLKNDKISLWKDLETK